MLSYALTYSNLLSPTSQRLAVHPLSPERETFEPLTPINSNSFCEIALFIFSSILISSSKNVCLLFYAIPRRIVNRQKLYRTKALKWTRLPFLWKFCKFLKQKICSQQRQAIVVAPLWRERGTIEDGGK